MQNLRLPVWAAFVFFLLLALARPAAAQDEPPGRVGRIAELQGSVSWFDHDEGRWSPAERNRPLTGGDRLATGPGARAELRIGSTVLRLSERTELELQRLDDERLVVVLQAGAFALRLKTREAAEEARVLTAEARLAPQRAGHYRFDRIDDSTLASVWRGELRVEGPGGWGLTDGQRVELFRDRGGELRGDWGTVSDDAFALWVQRDDAREGTTVSTRHVSPEMTGVEELDRHGRWSTHPEHGAIWFPLAVASDWAPYRDGRWVWLRPWGWTWVDAAPWGFAPFHYGRWTLWNGRWGWLPGAYVARPAFAPALVAPRAAPGVTVSIGIGSPPRHWEPLGPRDHYRPWSRPAPLAPERPRAPPPAWQPLQVQPHAQEPRQHLPRQPWREERTAEPLRPERPLPDAPRHEPPRQERPRLDPPRHEPPRPDRPRQELPRQEPREPQRAPLREAPREAVRPAPAPRADEAARRPEPKPGRHERGENVR